MSEAINITDLHFSYAAQAEDKPLTVFDGLDLTIEEGSFVAVLGHNGCGKSTLLGILAGSVKPDSGEVTYNGENPFKDRKVFCRYTGYVPQENPLMDKLSVYDNLRFWYCDSERSIEDC